MVQFSCDPAVRRQAWTAALCRAAALRLLAQLDAPLARTSGLLLRNVWLLIHVVIVLIFLSGGLLVTRMDRMIGQCGAVSGSGITALRGSTGR